jgi:hypothetical protein
MRRVSSLSDFIQNVEDRKRSIGVTEDAIRRARNTGELRTPAKREMLAAMRQRALEQGLEPIEANF